MIPKTLLNLVFALLLASLFSASAAAGPALDELAGKFSYPQAAQPAVSGAPFVSPDSAAPKSCATAAIKGYNVRPCKVLDFKIQLEGWSRPGEIGDNTPCSLVAISTQPTCPEAPCYNIACSAMVHYSAVVELPAEESLLYPACNFRQEYFGERGYHDNGKKTYLQFIPTPRVDFAGSVQWAPGAEMVPVEGKPHTYKVDFYDLPGWSPTYFNGMPNATAPQWFPLDWHFMYRAYLGPKYENFRDDDFTYIKVFMATGVPPAAAIPGELRHITLEEWQEYSRKLQELNLPTVGE